MSTFCIDTSAWIEFAHVYVLGDARFDGFWEWLNGLTEAGALISPSEVFEELKGDKEIGERLRQRRSAIEVEPDARLIGEFARLNRTYPELTKKKKVRAKNVADAWVIGYAKINRTPVASKEAL